MAVRHEPAPVPDPTPSHVHVRRSDGLDVEASGSAAFITAVLVGLGIVQAPPPA